MDPEDKNWYLHENRDFKGDPEIKAEISCVNDHAHIGYLIEDSKMIKTGLGKRMYEGPFHAPRTQDYK